MKYLLTFYCFLLFLGAANSQERYLTKNGKISFFSEAALENISAENKQVLSIIDVSNGNIAISILMKSFLFEKALMQEHFNENYVESDKYPKAIFKGKIADIELITNESKKFEIKGIITIHGESKEIIIEAAILKVNENLVVSGSFTINLDDFKVKIPAVVAKNIAKEIKISFDLKHEPFKK